MEMIVFAAAAVVLIAYLGWRLAHRLDVEIQERKRLERVLRRLSQQEGQHVSR